MLGSSGLEPKWWRGSGEVEAALAGVELRPQQSRKVEGVVLVDVEVEVAAREAAGQSVLT